jgi:DNA-binding transcriptional LysR family regulator
MLSSGQFVPDLEPLMDIAALADFHLIAAHGGLNKASRVSGKPKATLSRHVRDLEDSLGVRLVQRGARALRLTEEGQALHERTYELLREIVAAGDSLASGVAIPRGHLRVSAPVLLSQAVLARLAPRFITRYPEVTLEVVADDRQVDLFEEGFDVAVRVNPRRDDSMVGRCIANDEMLVVAAPSIEVPKGRAGHAPPCVPAISLTSSTSNEPWRFVTGRKERVIQPDFRLRLSSLLMVREAAREGGGVAALPASMLVEDLARGGLLVWGTVPDRRVEIWVLHSSRRLVSSKVSAFVSFLADAFPERKFPARA